MSLLVSVTDADREAVYEAIHQSGAAAAEVTAVASRPILFNLLTRTCKRQYASYVASATASGTPVQDFLTWLLNNGPALLAFIQQIISLFK